MINIKSEEELRIMREAGQLTGQVLRMLAEATGLSKSAVQTALECLRRRQLIKTTSEHATAVPHHRVLRHWRGLE